MVVNEAGGLSILTGGLEWGGQGQGINVANEQMGRREKAHVCCVLHFFFCCSRTNSMLIEQFGHVLQTVTQSSGCP